jgi:hypothetical protein
MARDDRAACTVECGVQTSNSKTILTVTEDLAEAERTLDMLGQGRLLKRTVSYSPWIAGETETRDLSDEAVPGSSDSSGPDQEGTSTSDVTAGVRR